MQLMFVRFVDELTPTHFSLLNALAVNEASAAALYTYEALRQFFLSIVKSDVDQPQFKLLCNDLQARVLVRFSDAIEDFGGLAVTNALATEDSGIGPMIMVTSLGHSFLLFVSECADEQPS
jgi:hypothetical protein